MTRRQSTSRKRGAAPPGRVRIVAGKWRGRFLPVIDADELRPTSERVRETVFNWLAPRIQGSRCLDLFAGTGVLGLEALSRGAAEAILVERDPKAADALRKSIAKLGASSATVVAGDALQFLTKADVRPMDLVFLDPPFAGAFTGQVIDLLGSRGWLAARASIYIEQDAATALPHLPIGLTVRRAKKAGNVRYLLADAESTGPDEGAS